ncbi:MAG: type II toxin-antitoxin system RelE/ParE family toxin [Deltaproteobacteria bacterium]|nr:type II toxin-antitoxin system RelE/ParE family toxin [Deltaproteobacteria bacterium]
MIVRVVLTKRAQRDTRGLPHHVVDKLATWVKAVQLRGLEEVRRIPGYHDEPLRGERRGQRSIRLSLQYRAIYRVQNDGRVEFVSVEEVHKHDY